MPSIVRVTNRDYTIDMHARRARYICHLLGINPLQVTIRVQVDENRIEPGIQVETTHLGESDFIAYDGSPSDEIVWEHEQQTQRGDVVPTMLRILPRPSTYPEGISVQQFVGYNAIGAQQWKTLEHPELYTTGHCDAAMRDPHEGHETRH